MRYDPAVVVDHVIPDNRVSIHYFVQRAYGQGVSDMHLAFMGGEHLPEEGIFGRFRVARQLQKRAAEGDVLDVRMRVIHRGYLAQCSLGYLLGLFDEFYRVSGGPSAPPAERNAAYRRGVLDAGSECPDAADPCLKRLRVQLRASAPGTVKNCGRLKLWQPI